MFDSKILDFKIKNHDMAKVEKKSITDLLGSKDKRRPSSAEIEAITQQIHQPVSKSVDEEDFEPVGAVDNVGAVSRVGALSHVGSVDTYGAVGSVGRVGVVSGSSSSSEVTVKRISVIAPVHLYIKAKSKATLQGKTLMAYVLDVLEADTRNM
jgi:hypothetical protein